MTTLQGVIRATTSEQRAVTRARIVLRAAEGEAIERIAAELGVAVMTVKLWRRRYAAAGLAGLRDAPRPGHPPTYTCADRDRLVALTMGPPPDGTTHWSVRAMARRTGMSPSTVHRIWRELGYKPHQTETFKFSTDHQIETWFGILTRQAIRRGSFRNVKELIARIEAFTRAWNAGSSPFMWVKATDAILARAVRKPPATSELGH